jgi:hypothetical protein
MPYPFSQSSSASDSDAMLLSQVLRNAGEPQRNPYDPTPSPHLVPLQARPIQPTPPTTQPPAQSNSVPTTQSLFEGANMVSPNERRIIEEFLSGQRLTPDAGEDHVRQILLSQRPEPGYVEQILFEINYAQGTWKKLRRRIPTSNPHM